MSNASFHQPEGEGDTYVPSEAGRTQGFSERGRPPCWESLYTL